MKNLNILFAGFGGQGVLFAGKVVAYAALIANKQLSWLPSYGPEMRGGTANCSVVISDEQVASPLVLNPDILMVMNVQSFDKFIDSVVPGGVVLVDSTLVSKKTTRTDISVYEVPATKLAADNGLEGLANMILMGKMLETTSFVSYDIMKKALEKTIPPKKAHLLDGNLKAIDMGMKYEG